MLRTNNLLSLFSIVFLLLSLISRACLCIYAMFDEQIDFAFKAILKIFAIGFVNDLVTLTYFFVLWSAIALFQTKKFSNDNLSGKIVKFLFFCFIAFLSFLIVAEFTFWLEFATRFNFIAVDYLIYTHEIINNVLESYPLFVILPIYLIVVMLLYFFCLKFYNQITLKFIPLKYRVQRFALTLIICLFGYYFYNPRIFNNNYYNELSRNGIYTFFVALKTNNIDYQNLYTSIEPNIALATVEDIVKQDNLVIDTKSLKRQITAKGEPKNYNVILVTLESMSSEFLEIKNGFSAITPVLNSLISKSIYFENFYATGTRTIRGLEALTLGIPPIPGQSILKRENNENLFSLGSVLKDAQYDLKFIYGGYGYFDNMNYFFTHNNFKSIDRAKFLKNEISFANAWGVCDEDLFNQVIKQADLSYQDGNKFFSLVMTTSNHRPYTYPEGRIDIPSKSNRHGGVKYSDYALGKFLEMAETKPWFDQTIFVITADHCAGSAGKTALPVEKYQIPLLIYAPKILKPAIISKISSQIDVAPTILALLNLSYQSQFFGNDIFTKSYENAFISTYQKLGYLEPGKLGVLSPGKKSTTYKVYDQKTLLETQEEQNLTKKAVSFYQSAYTLFYNNLLKISAK